MSKLREPTRRPSRRLRCAIYTRKSSDEGLEQAFNTLDAQREACAAFILSQKHEGWTVLPTLYDDGGYSGGTLDRPALQRLLADIAEAKVDVVAVYKIDRLTRSLFDFAKIVEAFDARGVSFVSITQQFNTTTSMGRLTLNVLLSFAQFEREVAGERIRDKIAASKKKGMWMGGLPALGYDVRDRKLIVNKEEAQTLLYIFRRYVELRSVRALKVELDAAGIRSKHRSFTDGTVYGGHKLSRGALYLMLQNRIYRGEITHKGSAYPGEHKAIVDNALWDKVQAVLAEKIDRATGADAKYPSLLAGLAFDENGERLTPLRARIRRKIVSTASNRIRGGEKWPEFARNSTPLAKAIKTPLYQLVSVAEPAGFELRDTVLPILAFCVALLLAPVPQDVGSLQIRMADPIGVGANHLSPDATPATREIRSLGRAL
jgi:site-specific DNA recombinase